MPQHQHQHRHHHHHHSHHSHRKTEPQIPNTPICASVSEIPSLPFPVECPTRGWCRQRLQIIEIELAELNLFVEPPLLIPAWYQTTSYHISFHPTSEPIAGLPFPEQIPECTEPGKHVVSQNSTTRKVAAHVNGETFVEVVFGEKLFLPMDFLHDNMVVYIWGSRGNAFQNEEVILVGYCICCLTDFTLQGSPAAWSIHGSSTGYEFAELTMQYAITTTPGPVRNPVAVDVSNCQVKLEWIPPLNSYGSPVTAYKIEMLIERRHKHPKWQTVCAIESPATDFVIQPLLSESPYVFRVSAVNQVGAGDPCEFHFITPPAPNESRHSRHVHRGNHKMGHAELKDMIRRKEERCVPTQCLRCWFPTNYDRTNYCLCSRMPPLTFKTTTNFMIYMHPQDWYNTGDAKILLSAAPLASDIFVFGRPGDDEKLKRSIRRCSIVLLLSSDASAISMEDFVKTQNLIDIDISNANVGVVVLDGTCNNVEQIQKHFSKHVGPRVPHVKLDPAALSAHARTHNRKDGISSLEAVALLLREFGESPAVCDELARYVTINDAALSLRADTPEKIDDLY